MPDQLLWIKLLSMSNPPLGLTNSCLDGKHRLKVPALFESVLPPRSKLIVTLIDAETICIYPAEIWARKEFELISQKGSTGSETTWSSELDETRRVLLGAELRERIQLRDANVVLYWKNDHIELKVAHRYREKIEALQKSIRSR